MRQRRVHAFKQSPWRAQLRLTGASMLPLTVLLVVGGMYLAVSARQAQIGRRVLELERERANLVRKNAELTAILAEMISPERLMERASALGFRPASPEEIEYIQVEGYSSPRPFVAPSPSASTNLGEGVLSPAYTETLGAWLSRWLGLGTGGG